MFNNEEEQYILDSIKQIKKETHENNIVYNVLTSINNYNDSFIITI